MLIRSCVFHYELELIHPFADGNGRVGLLWHTLLLSKLNSAFAWFPVESIIHDRRSIILPSTPPMTPESPQYLLSSCSQLSKHRSWMQSIRVME